jgi:hypothetical protein
MLRWTDIFMTYIADSVCLVPVEPVCPTVGLWKSLSVVASAAINASL